MKQYYSIIKSSSITKNKQFSGANILISDRSIPLNKQPFFDFKNIFIISICQDGKLVEGWDIIAI